jgi:hypothetical protein
MHEEWPDWAPGDPVPDGFHVHDGDPESGPCEPYISPIEYDECPNGHGEQEVVKHLVSSGFDPTAYHKLKCDCVVF